MFSRVREDEKYPELFFGLVGPLGTDLDKVEEELTSELRGVGYDLNTIRMSSLIPSVPPASETEDGRMERLMKAGDDLCGKLKMASAIARLAIVKIRRLRDLKHESKSDAPEIRNSNRQTTQIPLTQTAYLFRSLKRPEEVKLLRQAYGRNFFLISVGATRAERIKSLAESIRDSHRKHQSVKFEDRAKELVEYDEKAIGQESGQNVRKTYHLADVFVAADQTSKQIARFIRRLFGHPFVTPTKSEYGMSLAWNAALKSADLSRQVGAAVLDGGDCLVTGCNEVPSPQGGMYWEGDSIDRRDFTRGFDPNERIRNELASELLAKLGEQGVLSEAWAKKSNDEKLIEMLKNPILKGCGVMSPIEYGTVVHAEMQVITTAARRGLSVKGTTLFCTTYPCHVCARHVLACGFKRVVYIEPYPKSRTKELYEDAVSVEGEGNASDALKFESFIGIAPTQYARFFQMTPTRKIHGSAVKWRASGDNVPELATESPVAYMREEAGIAAKSKQLLSVVLLMRSTTGAYTNKDD